MEWVLFFMLFLLAGVFFSGIAFTTLLLIKAFTVYGVLGGLGITLLVFLFLLFLTAIVMDE